MRRRSPTGARPVTPRIVAIVGLLVLGLLALAPPAIADVPIQPGSPTGGGGTAPRPTTIPSPTTVPTPTTVPGGGSGPSSTIGGSTVTTGGATSIPVPTTSASGGGSGSAGDSGSDPWVPIYATTLLLGGAGIAVAAAATRRRRTEGARLLDDAVATPTGDVVALDTTGDGATSADAPTVAAASATASASATAGAASVRPPAASTPASGPDPGRPSPSVVASPRPERAATGRGPTPPARDARFDVAAQLAVDWATADAAAERATALAERLRDAAQLTVARQAADDRVADSRRADAQRITAIENRLKTLEGVEGVDVERWRSRLVAELERVRAS